MGGRGNNCFLPCHWFPISWHLGRGGVRGWGVVALADMSSHYIVQLLALPANSFVFIFFIAFLHVSLFPRKVLCFTAFCCSYLKNRGLALSCTALP